MSSKKTIGKKLREQKEKLKQQATKEIKKEVLNIFEEFPLLQSFKIVGYTPYFNDGGECVFSFREYLTEINNIQVGECYGNPPRFDSFYEDESENKKFIEENLFWLVPAYKKIWELFDGIGEDIFSEIFGSHVSVHYSRIGEPLLKEHTDHD